MDESKRLLIEKQIRAYDRALRHHPEFSGLLLRVQLRNSFTMITINGHHASHTLRPAAVLGCVRCSKVAEFFLDKSVSSAKDLIHSLACHLINFFNCRHVRELGGKIPKKLQASYELELLTGE